jgi:signal transduction histidine kinase
MGARGVGRGLVRGIMSAAVEAGGGTTAISAAGPGLVGQSSVRDTHLARAIRVLIILTVVSNVAYFAALLLPGDPASTLIDTWLWAIAQSVPVCVFWLVAVRTRFRRWEVILAAAGVTFNAVGETFYVIAMDASGDVPSPSLPDLGYLLYYPLTMAALFVLVRRQSRNSVKSVIFDGALASLGAAAVLAVILGPVFTDATSDTTPIDGAIAALYPLFDLLLITAVVGISASPILRIGPRWQFLVLGFLLFTGADIAYALLNHDGTYNTGTPLDAAWTAGVACGALWVDGVGRLEPEPRAPTSKQRLLPVPAFAVLAGLAVLLIATQTSVPSVALVLAAATVALSAASVMFRQRTLTRMLEGQEHVVEQLKALDKSKGDMISTVSHEMRTPLTSIAGYLELVLDDEEGVLPKDAKDMLLIVERNNQRLQKLADNMLLITRLESGAATTAAVPIEIAWALQRVTESLRPFADSRHVELSMVCDEGVIVEGDENQLERAFTNLIENAVKFTSATGSVRIKVAPATGHNAAPAITIDFIDTGMGIPADEVPHLFDRFFRATNAQDHAVQGTGLGLAIVRDIVQAHQGDVSVSSVLSEGTTFRITLPVRTVPAIGSDASCPSADR